MVSEIVAADRILDIIMVEEAQTNHNFGERPYYGFEHVTMVKKSVTHDGACRC